MLIGAGMKHIYLAECFVAQPGGVFCMHLTQDSAGKITMFCGIAGKLAGLGRKSSALGQCQSMYASLAMQFRDCVLFRTASISACQSHAAPCIAVIEQWKAPDAGGNFLYVSAIYKP